MVVRFYFDLGENPRIPRASSFLKGDVYGDYIEIRDPRLLLDEGETPEFVAKFIDEVNQITLRDTLVSVQRECGSYDDPAKMVKATLQPSPNTGGSPLPPGCYSYEFWGTAYERPSNSGPGYQEPSLPALIRLYREIREGKGLKPTASWDKPISTALAAKPTIVIEKLPLGGFRAYIADHPEWEERDEESSFRAIGKLVKHRATELGINVE